MLEWYSGENLRTYSMRYDILILVQGWRTLQSTHRVSVVVTVKVVWMKGARFVSARFLICAHNELLFSSAGRRISDFTNPSSACVHHRLGSCYAPFIIVRRIYYPLWHARYKSLAAIRNVFKSEMLSICTLPLESTERLFFLRIKFGDLYYNFLYHTDAIRNSFEEHLFS